MTFASKRCVLLEYLKANGWDVREWHNGEPLKTPHATMGDVRILVRARSAHVVLVPQAYGARVLSITSDIRQVDGPELVRLALETAAFLRSNP